jgi:hypothetical protein
MGKNQELKEEKKDCRIQGSKETKKKERKKKFVVAVTTRIK